MRFNVVTGSIAGLGLVVGTIGAVELAAHQLAISLYFTLSIIGLAVGEAVMVLLAASLARGSYVLARKFALGGLALSMLLMSIIALLLLFYPTLIAQSFIGRHSEDTLTLIAMGEVLQFSVLALIGGGIYETLAMYLRPLNGSRYLLKVGHPGDSGFWRRRRDLGAISLWQITLGNVADVRFGIVPRRLSALARSLAAVKCAVEEEIVTACIIFLFLN